MFHSSKLKLISALEHCLQGEESNSILQPRLTTYNKDVLHHVNILVRPSDSEGVDRDNRIVCLEAYVIYWKKKWQ